MDLGTIQYITLDLTVPRIKNVRCVEEDSGTRVINITVTNKGESYPLQKDNMAARYKIRKPDSTYIYNTVPINDDGTVTIELTKQAMAVAGIAKSELQISDTKSGDIISTMPFNIIIEKSVLSNEDIISGNESDIIDGLESIIGHISNKNNPHEITAETIGLGNVDNTQDINKPISILQQEALDSKADVDSPKLTGIPNAPTAVPGTDSEQIATTAFVQEVKKVLDSEMNSKVDKVSGKGLSTNDYTTAEKEKLNGIESNANNYKHPASHPASMIMQDPSHRFSTDDEKNTWNSMYEQSTQYTDNKIAELIDGAPETMDTLKEIADEIANNKSTEQTLNEAIGKKANQAELDTHTSNNNIHVTVSEKQNWNMDTTERTATFSQATSRMNIASGDKIGVILGKIKKFFSDLKAVAFTGSYNDLTDKPAIPSQPSDIGALPSGDNAVSASKWQTARNINGMSIDGSASRANYGTCATSASTAAKTVACTGFSLMSGAEITVKFSSTNTASNPTLNVNGTGAKPIYYRGSAIAAGYLAANRTYTFRYNGAQWDFVGDINVNTDTNTWKANTKDSEGYVAKGSGNANKVWKTDESGNPGWRDEAGGSNIAGVTGVKGNAEESYRKGDVNLTPENIGAAPNNHTHNYSELEDTPEPYVHPSYTAKNNGLYKVTIDNKGHISATTAVTKSDITSLGIPGTDTNTTYNTGTASTSGITKLYTTTGNAIDGAMTQRAIKEQLDKRALITHVHNYAGSESAGGALTAGVKISASNVVDKARSIWFSSDTSTAESSQAVYDTNFTYNPATHNLKVANFNSNVISQMRATYARNTWYKIAVHDYSDVGWGSCIIDLKRIYNNTNNEYHRLFFLNTHKKYEFASIASKSNDQVLTKIRLVINAGGKSYIEVYYAVDSSNAGLITIENAADDLGNPAWSAMYPTADTETPAEGTVAAQFDIPANSLPATTSSNYYLPLAGGTLSDQLIVETVTGKDAFLNSLCSDTGNKIGFGVSTSGINRGIWDYTLKKWILRVNQNGNPDTELAPFKVLGGITLPPSGTVLQQQAASSNSTNAITWDDASEEAKTHKPAISRHNWGKSITILPYTTDTNPWTGSVGLYISKDSLSHEGKSILKENNFSKYVTAASIGAAATNHTHNYAGAATPGGALTSGVAMEAATSDKNRHIWFSSDESTAACAKPVYNDNLTYNPVTNNLNIGTFNSETISQRRTAFATKAWYKIMEYGAADVGTSSCIIDIKRQFSNSNNEYHRFMFLNTYKGYEFAPIADKSNYHSITKARLVTGVGGKCYIEVYYDSMANNTVHISIEGTRDPSYNAWKAINPTVDTETPEAGSVAAIYDIPENFNNKMTALKDETLPIITDIGSTKDFNNITGSGIYLLKNILDFNNSPPKDNISMTAILIVINNNNVLCSGYGTCIQILYSFSNTKLKFIRCSTMGTTVWDDWKLEGSFSKGSAEKTQYTKEIFNGNLSLTSNYTTILSGYDIDNARYESSLTGHQYADKYIRLRITGDCAGRTMNNQAPFTTEMALYRDNLLGAECYYALTEKTVSLSSLNNFTIRYRPFSTNVNEASLSNEISIKGNVSIQKIEILFEQ